MKKLRIFRAISLGIALVAALMFLSYAVWSTPWFGKKDPSFILGLGIAMGLANAMAIHTKLKKEADPDRQRTTRGM
jgi:hypothetical protein